MLADSKSGSNDMTSTTAMVSCDGGRGVWV